MNGIRALEPINVLIPQIRTRLSFQTLRNLAMTCKDTYYVDGNDLYQKARRIYRQNEKAVTRRINPAEQRSILFNCIVLEMIEKNAFDEILMTFALTYLYKPGSYSYQREVLNMCLNQGSLQIYVLAYKLIKPSQKLETSCTNCGNMFLSRNFVDNGEISSNDGLCAHCDVIFRSRRLTEWW